MLHRDIIGLLLEDYSNISVFIKWLLYRSLSLSVPLQSDTLTRPPLDLNTPVAPVRTSRRSHLLCVRQRSQRFYISTFVSLHQSNDSSIFI